MSTAEHQPDVHNGELPDARQIVRYRATNRSGLLSLDTCAVSQRDFEGPQAPFGVDLSSLDRVLVPGLPTLDDVRDPRWVFVATTLMQMVDLAPGTPTPLSRLGEARRASGIIVRKSAPLPRTAAYGPPGEYARQRINRLFEYCERTGTDPMALSNAHLAPILGFESAKSMEQSFWVQGIKAKAIKLKAHDLWRARAKNPN